MRQPEYDASGRKLHMTSITAVAEAFFAACDAGQGWEHCRAYCTPEATFSAQAEPLLGVKTLAEYTDWMKGLMTVLPDGRYELKSLATDGSSGSQELKSLVTDGSSGSTSAQAVPTYALAGC